MAYNKALTKDKIKFVDIRFKGRQIVGFRESSGW